MNTPINFRTLSIMFFVALATSYVLCILGGILFGWTMYEVWAPLMPGFTWPVTVGGLLIGLLWIVGYSLYGALLLVVPYNYLTRRSATAE
jgi:hypothetical protein